MKSNKKFETILVFKKFKVSGLEQSDLEINALKSVSRWETISVTSVFLSVQETKN